MRLSQTRKACVTAMMKDSIFEAASSVLEQHGAGGLTMDRVATRVGVSTGNLYNYFRDKSELLRFAYDRLVGPYFEAIEQIATGDLSAPKKLEAILRTAWEYATTHKGLIRLIGGDSQCAQLRQEVRPRGLQLLKSIFEQGIREGSFRPHNPLHTGRMFQGCIAELFEMRVENAADADVDEYVNVLIDATVNGFSIHVPGGPASNTENSV